MKLISVSGELARNIYRRVELLFQGFSPNDLVENIISPNLIQSIQSTIENQLSKFLGPDISIARKSKFFVGPSKGKGESWCHYLPKSNSFEWLMDLNSMVSVEQFFSTFFHECIHLEQSARMVVDKQQKLKILKPHSKWWEVPFGPGEKALQKMDDPYLEDPQEIEAYAVELSELIKRNLNGQQIKEILNQILSDPNHLGELIENHFDQTIGDYLVKAPQTAKRKFLKILYTQLSTPF